ncbi:LCI fold-containing protein [Flavobacterium laiguense]
MLWYFKSRFQESVFGTWRKSCLPRKALSIVRG